MVGVKDGSRCGGRARRFEGNANIPIPITIILGRAPSAQRDIGIFGATTNPHASRVSWARVWNRSAVMQFEHRVERRQWFAFL